MSADSGHSQEACPQACMCRHSAEGTRSRKIHDSANGKAQLAFTNETCEGDDISTINTEMMLSARQLDTGQQQQEHKQQDVHPKSRSLKKAVILICMAGALQGVLVNGLINVVISTIEKRFQIRSAESGFIAGSYDLASFLCLLPVSYLGGRGSKSRWIGGGLAIMGAGSLLFSLPHFTSGAYQEEETLLTYCNLTHTCQNDLKEKQDNRYKYVFMAAQLLHGAGAAPLYTLGVTYIDDIVGPGSSAFYLGVFYTMAIVGPAIGYSVGGQLLNLHTDIISGNYADHLTPQSSAWIGAWWLGFLLVGVCCLLLAGPIVALPAKKHQVEELSEKPGNGQDQTDVNFMTATGPIPVGKELLRAIQCLLTNPTFMFLNLAGACEGFLIQGLATFLPKFIQNQYSVSASVAAIEVGAVSVIAGGGGTLLGGFIVKRLALSVPGLLKLVCVTQSVAILFGLGLLADCPSQQVVGLDMVSDCSVDCSCNRFDYDPVCGGNTTYFNPCWAGCPAPADTLADFPQQYHNCSCSPVSSLVTDVAKAPSLVTKGPCPSSCPYLPLFLASFFLTMLVTFLANMPTVTATLRCVEPQHRAFALGIQWLVVRALGTIPGPVAMGSIFDWSCKHWEEKCDSSSGACLIYHNSNVSQAITGLMAVCKLLSIVAFVFAVRMFQPKAVDGQSKSKDMSNIRHINPASQ